MTERPRDRLGRPLAWDAVGFPGVEQRVNITSREAIDEATAYLDEGLPFHAHEVLEMRWRCCPADERALWRGLAQAAAGVTHAARGNQVGAGRLITRGQVSIEEYVGPVDESTQSLIDSLTAPRSASDV